MKNLIARFVALLCAVILLAVLLVMALPAIAAAAPTISVGSAAVTQGGTCCVNVTGSNLSALTSLKLTVAYDPDVFTVTETAVRGMDVATADSKTTLGEINYIGISMDGISGEQELLSITFRAAADAPVGEYAVTLFSQGATADKSGKDEIIDVSKVDGVLTVAESGEVYFHLYSNKDVVESGDEVILTVSSWSLNNLAGGRFTFLYDSNLFAYQSIELLSTMTASTHAYTINDANEGRILLSFASEEAVTGGELMCITLRANDNVSGTAQITMETADLVDVNAAPVTASAVSTTVNVTEKARVWLELSDDMNTHESFAVGFWVEGTSGLAAGDFSVSYDAEELECLGVTVTSNSNAYVVVDDNWGDGSIKFSVLVPQGISSDTEFLTMEFRVRNNAQTAFTLVPAATTTPVNRFGGTLILEYPTVSGTVNVSDHLCVNGYCTVCEKDVATVSVCDGMATVSVPGVAENTRIVVAFYTENHQMIDCVMSMSGTDMPFRSEVSASAAEAAETVIFILNEQWVPLRSAIEI